MHARWYAEWFELYPLCVFELCVYTTQAQWDAFYEHVITPLSPFDVMPEY